MELTVLILIMDTLSIMYLLVALSVIFTKHSMQEIEFFEWVQKVYKHIFNTTTGVAAKNLNRNFIGIEMDEGYFKIAKERIEKA